MFTSSTGQPLDQRNVLRMFRRLLRKAKLPRMRFHDLRHSCASLLLAQHVSPRVVMETLGHSQSPVTMDTYTHVMPALMQDCGRRDGSFVGLRPNRLIIGWSLVRPNRPTNFEFRA